jgi:hypothetical protein
MTGPHPEFLLRYAVRRDAGDIGPCLDDHTIAALAEGTLDGPARVAALPHIASCARCRVAIASVSAALSEPSLAREIATTARARPRLPRIAVAALAAAVLLIVAVPRRGNEDGPLHRSPGITAVASPVLVAPAGVVRDVGALRWATVGGADRYRATLFDGTGVVLYEIQTADTVVALPDSVRLAPGRSYLWKVEARTGWGRWSASELIVFTIR